MSESTETTTDRSPVDDTDQPVDASTDAPADGAQSDGDRRTRTQILEEEGDIAADYLEELLDIVDVADGRAQVAIVNEDGGDELGPLVGRDGQVLSALQELTRLTVQTQTGQRSWLMLDIDGFRDRRKDDLREVAQKAVDEVRDSGEPVSLRAMNSFERKVVHDVVAQAGMRSESEGEGDRRHVVVHPA